MKPKNTFHLSTVHLLTVICLLALSACSGLGGESANGGLIASGFIAADQIRVAPEISGKVLAIQVEEGDPVQAGEVLFSLDDELLQAQAGQARAAVTLAEASLEAAKAQQSSAALQVEVAVQQARLAEIQSRSAAWSVKPSDEIDLPAWYFEKDERMAAAQAEVDAASKALEVELANLQKELADASSEDFIAAETRLAKAQAAFQVAEQTLDQAKLANEKDDLEDAAQKQLDTAESELDAAQQEYDRMLNSSASEDVLEARARAAVARRRLEIALDSLTSLQTGQDALQVQAARSALAQAQKAIPQAEANLAQAQAALKLVELQLARCQVKAPVAGVVLSLNVEAGELLSAGGVALTLGQLDDVSLTVYVPEDQYGQIKLGQQVTVRVDSYPEAAYSGQVEYISDQAEFTPRNVQTVEGRKSTVFAVKISLPNADLSLKPGMPADVDFVTP
ncbi:MAG: HlyD family efflux transporter periplasmic adaptor subunit [Anaerolineales bacterium]|nr:HlyD family efflux transporter periplasmic adaptor subunit [Anaerolineales bacterium]